MDKCVKNGIKFAYIDQEVMLCRVGARESLSTGQASISLKKFISERAVTFYYQYSEWEKRDFEDAVHSIIKQECEIYNRYLSILNSKAYKIGKAFLLSLKFVFDFR